VYRREDRSERGTDGPQQRLVQGFHHGHVAAKLACDRGHLEPDEAGTDDHQGSLRAQTAPELAGVVGVAEVADALQVTARDLEPARARAGGEQHAVGCQGLAVVQQDRADGWVDGSCPNAQLDLIGAELLLGNDRAERGLHVVDVYQLLRQGRSLIGRMRLRADDHDLAGKPGLARGHRGADAGRARTDHDLSSSPHGPVRSFSQSDRARPRGPESG
jgi:hypothetical protein